MSRLPGAHFDDVLRVLVALIDPHLVIAGAEHAGRDGPVPCLGAVDANARVVGRRDLEGRR